MTEQTEAVERVGKPRSRGMINVDPTSIEMIPRHVGRIKRLRQAIIKATEREQPERVASLQAEIDRRMADVAVARDALSEIDGD